MGLVGIIKTDIFKRERVWFNVNLSTPESVKGLLKHRKQLDLKFGRKFNDVNLNTTEVDLSHQTDEVTCLYIWIDEILDRMNITKRQKDLLDRFINSSSELEIAMEDGQSVQNINRIINTICKNISGEALRDWRKWVYKEKLGMRTKNCSKCKSELPATIEFFRARRNSRGDGFYNQCKKCERNAKCAEK